MINCVLYDLKHFSVRGSLKCPRNEIFVINIIALYERICDIKYSTGSFFSSLFLLETLYSIQIKCCDVIWNINICLLQIYSRKFCAYETKFFMVSLIRSLKMVLLFYSFSFTCFALKLFQHIHNEKCMLITSHCIMVIVY